MTIPQYVKDSDDISGVISIEQLKIDLDKNMEMMNLMVGILIVAAVLLGIIVLYNMGVLSFLEKTREVATLKVLGFSSGRIRRILRQQNNWITTVSYTHLRAGRDRNPQGIPYRVSLKRFCPK